MNNKACFRFGGLGSAVPVGNRHCEAPAFGRVDNVASTWHSNSVVGEAYWNGGDLLGWLVI